MTVSELDVHEISASDDSSQAVAIRKIVVYFFVPKSCQVFLPSRLRHRLYRRTRQKKIAVEVHSIDVNFVSNFRIT